MKDHKGSLFAGADKRKCAYQDEHCTPGCYIEAYPRRRDNVDGRNVPFNDPKYFKFEFILHKHTDNSMTIELRAHLNGSETIRQRKEQGYATKYEIYQTTLSFGELMNRIFAPGCQVFSEDEGFPEEVKEVMKKAYK